MTIHTVVLFKKFVLINRKKIYIESIFVCQVSMKCIFVVVKH